MGLDTSTYMELPPSENPTAVEGRAAIAELDGCVRLVTKAAGSGSTISQLFSLSGVMTAKNPTSLLGKPGTSNGYGTLMEVGWGPVEDLGSKFARGPNDPLAMAAYQGKLFVFFAGSGSQQVQMAAGSYSKSS